MGVRRNRAPKGALRPVVTIDVVVDKINSVRKHRAPKGALRRGSSEPRGIREPHVRKRRAPKGALRLRKP